MFVRGGAIECVRSADAEADDPLNEVVDLSDSATER